MRRTLLVPFLLACLIGAVWLNQGIRHADAQDQAAELGASVRHPVSAVRYVLLLLYMRSGDEEIYHAVASAIRGLPYDHQRLADRGKSTPPGFDRAPPEDGHWHRPYAEVPIEYPIAVLPFILVPSFACSLMGGNSFEVYGRAFSLLMAALLLGAAALAIKAQPARDERERWVAFAWLLLGAGSLAVQRLDAAPAFFLALSVWAAAERRPATLGIAMGVATATKLLPVLLIAPLLAADREAWRSPRACIRGLAAFGVTVAIGFAPMLFPPEALLGVLRYHAVRGLQIESTAAVLLGAWQILTRTAIPAEISYGSFNIGSPAANLFARLSLPLTLLSMACLTVLFVRAPAPQDDVARRDRVALAMLTGLCALWLTAKVFSPQYLTWGLPIVLAVSGKLGKTLTWMFFSVVTATQILLCGLYVYVVAITPIGQTALLVRLALLVAFSFVAIRAVAGLSRARQPRAAVATGR